MRLLISFALLFALPLVISYSYLPVSSFAQGNKKRTPYKVVRNINFYSMGDCSKLIDKMQGWDGGMQFFVNFENDQNTDIDSWEIEITTSKDVNSLISYDGTTEKVSSRVYKIKSKSYNGKIAVGAKLRITVHIQYPPSDTEPKIVTLRLNQMEYQCSEVPATSGTTAATTPAAPTTATTATQEDNDDSSPVVVTQPENPRPEYPAQPGGGKKRGVHVPWPKKVMGLYILLADDDEEGFESEADWDPQLFSWQQEASNVLFFTFIHPETMAIPPSFKKLAATRGTNAPGAVPKDTVILFAIGGYAYSLKPNPWWWLESKEEAEKMAEKVAEWPKLYNCDGIDLDLEEGAGSNKIAGPNMVHFIRRLRKLVPDIIISQPTYGYPAVQAEIDVINASWDKKANSKNLADAIGLMVYEGTQSLNYVKNYAKGSEQWEGFPVKVNAPTNTILLGAKGASSSSSITALANAAVDQDLLGIMVWYASVKNGFHYAVSWDASIVEDSIKGYKNAMNIFNRHMNKKK